MALHQAQGNRTRWRPLDDKRQQRVDALRAQAQRSREFLAQTPKRTNGQGKELKTNVTDPDSAKMATSKGVIKGYAAQAAVDSKNQVIVAADVIGSGSEQSMLLPMVEQSHRLVHEQTLYTADAGYHSDSNVTALNAQGTPALCPRVV